MGRLRLVGGRVLRIRATYTAYGLCPFPLASEVAVRGQEVSRHATRAGPSDGLRTVWAQVHIVFLQHLTRRRTPPRRSQPGLEWDQPTTGTTGQLECRWSASARAPAASAFRPCPRYRSRDDVPDKVVVFGAPGDRVSSGLPSCERSERCPLISADPQHRPATRDLRVPYVDRTVVGSHLDAVPTTRPAVAALEPRELEGPLRLLVVTHSSLATRSMSSEDSSVLRAWVRSIPYRNQNSLTS